MSVEQQTMASRTDWAERPNPLLVVMSWELRRVGSSWRSGAMAVATLLFFMWMVWFKHFWVLALVKDSRGGQVTIFGTTALGLLFEFINALLLFYWMFLPFVVTGAISRDHKRRVHELLMATPVPTWAFVWGRFLAALVVSLGLSALLLVAMAVVGQIVHLTSPIFPAADPLDLAQDWGLLVLPASVLACAVGVVLGALWPRRAVTIETGALVVWLMLFVLADFFQTLFGPTFGYFNPTGVPILVELIPRFIQEMQARVPPGANAAQINEIALRLEQVKPDLTPWVIPHLILVAISLGIVAMGALVFQRFRNVME